MNGAYLMETPLNEVFSRVRVRKISKAVGGNRVQLSAKRLTQWPTLKRLSNSQPVSIMKI